MQNSPRRIARPLPVEQHVPGTFTAEQKKLLETDAPHVPVTPESAHGQSIAPITDHLGGLRRSIGRKHSATPSGSGGYPSPLIANKPALEREDCAATSPSSSERLVTAQSPKLPGDRA
jgi:hypothetical protein